ncbi:hypothetical protein C8R44DRAFT_744840 [Mycena epipterygia]|nr:hypothetical protein C8R44DRAFT_744840 [Mycena epipterygia]
MPSKLSAFVFLSPPQPTESLQIFKHCETRPKSASFGQCYRAESDDPKEPKTDRDQRVPLRGDAPGQDRNPSQTRMVSSGPAYWSGNGPNSRDRARQTRIIPRPLLVRIRGLRQVQVPVLVITRTQICPPVQPMNLSNILTKMTSRRQPSSKSIESSVRLSQITPNLEQPLSHNFAGPDFEETHHQSELENAAGL